MDLRTREDDLTRKAGALKQGLTFIALNSEPETGIGEILLDIREAKKKREIGTI